MRHPNHNAIRVAASDGGKRRDGQAKVQSTEVDPVAADRVFDDDLVFPVAETEGEVQLGGRRPSAGRGGPSLIDYELTIDGDAQGTAAIAHAGEF